MNEGGKKQPLHDELEGQDEKTSEEESGGGEPVPSKRRHVRSQRMQEYLQQQDKAVPQKRRKCSYPGCDKVFSSNPGLRYHERTHLPDASSFSCGKCKKTFKSHNGLKYHRQKTKCQDTPAAGAPAALPPPLPLLPPPLLPQPLSVPTATELEAKDTHTAVVGSVPPPAKNDEPDSLRDVSPGEPESQKWPEPRHRKMESRRKKMEQAARRTAAELEHSGTSEGGLLLEFAEIATGPQSPLLTRRAMDWEQARLQRETEAESARDVIWCRPVWQCFQPGTKVSIGEDVSSPWYPVENIAGSQLQRHGLVLPEDLRRPVPVYLLSKQKSAEHEDEVELTFACESSLQSRLTASCVASHPFFVRNKGWASCDCKKTNEKYGGLMTSHLETGDVCLPPSSSRQTSSARDAGGTEVNTLEYSSVVALSEMAQKRSQEGSGGQQQQQQTTPVSPDDQHAPKAKRPMNAFLLRSQTRQPEVMEGRSSSKPKFPQSNSKDSSSMQSKEWLWLSESEKRQLQNEAKVKADLQTPQYLDCWKRKHHH